MIKKKKLKKVKLIDKQMLMKAKLANYLSRGLDLSDACTLSKCSASYLGILRSDPEFEEFIQQCFVENENQYLQAIESAAQLGNWAAAAWYLERRFPDKYAKKDIVKHEYEIRVQTFQKVVLEILDEVDPTLSLKSKVLQKLRDFEFKTIPQIENNNNGATIDINQNEYVEI